PPVLVREARPGDHAEEAAKVTATGRRALAQVVGLNRFEDRQVSDLDGVGEIYPQQPSLNAIGKEPADPFQASLQKHLQGVIREEKPPQGDQLLIGYVDKIILPQGRCEFHGSASQVRGTRLV